MQKQVWVVCPSGPREQVHRGFRNPAPYFLPVPDPPGLPPPFQQQRVYWWIFCCLFHNIIHSGYQGKTWRHVPIARPGTVSPSVAVLCGCCCPGQWLCLVFKKIFSLILFLERIWWEFSRAPHFHYYHYLIFYLCFLGEVSAWNCNLGVGKGVKRS